jgi:hypothetical protein
VPDRGFVVLDQAPQPGGAWQFRWPPAGVLVDLTVAHHTKPILKMH